MSQTLLTIITLFLGSIIPAVLWIRSMSNEKSLEEQKKTIWEKVYKLQFKNTELNTKITIKDLEVFELNTEIGQWMLKHARIYDDIILLGKKINELENANNVPVPDYLIKRYIENNVIGGVDLHKKGFFLPINLIIDQKEVSILNRINDVKLLHPHILNIFIEGNVNGIYVTSELWNNSEFVRIKTFNEMIDEVFLVKKELKKYISGMVEDSQKAKLIQEIVS